MLSRIIYLAFPVLLLAGDSLMAQRFPPPPPPGDLSGTYVNTSNGGTCEVYREGRDYVFVNENGTPARFRFVGPGRLRMVAGDWNPTIVATVGVGRDGRPFLRFQEAGNPPGYWVQQE
ncbi:MAG: hypothetical protein HYS12_24890 [Planctomycetes bacterium]|nr:hypothetical protein [Planctomycetota bacterium]